MGVEIVDDFLGYVADGTHRDDDAVSVGRAVVVEELVVGAELLVDLAHVLFHDFGESVVVLVAGLAVLEERIAVLVGAAHGGVLGVEGVLAERLDSVHVAHVGEILIIPHSDLLDLVGGAETVEEVDEGHLAGKSGQMRNGGEIHDLLHVALAQHGETGLAAGHNVGVIAEDVQRVGGNGTGGNVEHAGELLSRDLVHVRDHQQQALRGRVGGGQRTGAERAVHCAGCTGFRLHLDDLDLAAEDVLQTICGPLVDQVGHRGGRRNGINCRNFTVSIAYVCRSIIAVHGFHFSCHK